MSKLSQFPSQPSNGPAGSTHSRRSSSPGSLLGLPLGDLGWFATLLLSLASGFTVFFAATFVGIIAILFYNTSGHHSLDFAMSYRRVGFPLGVLVGVFALLYLGGLWIRRQLRRA